MICFQFVPTSRRHTHKIYLKLAPLFRDRRYSRVETTIRCGMRESTDPADDSSLSGIAFHPNLENRKKRIDVDTVRAGDV